MARGLPLEVVATLSVPLREVHKDRATDYLNDTARGGFGIKPGLGTADVADAIGLTVPTTHKLLTGLGWAGNARTQGRVLDERPIRWRRGQSW